MELVAAEQRRAQVEEKAEEGARAAAERATLLEEARAELRASVAREAALRVETVSKAEEVAARFVEVETALGHAREQLVTQREEADQARRASERAKREGALAVGAAVVLRQRLAVVAAAATAAEVGRYALGKEVGLAEAEAEAAAAAQRPRCAHAPDEAPHATSNQDGAATDGSDPSHVAPPSASRIPLAQRQRYPNPNHMPVGRNGARNSKGGENWKPYARKALASRPVAGTSTRG